MTKKRQLNRNLRLSKLLAALRQRGRRVVLVVAFMLVGITVLVFSKASTLANNVQAEGGSRSPSVVVISPSSASGGQAVKFAASMSMPMGSILLQNQQIKTWMNARQSDPNPVPTACVNLECTETGDNGPSPGQGQFRLGCQYSHFNSDDPIVFPGQPGKAHLHMFFGNTNVTSSTHYDPNDMSQNSLTHYGGSSCQGAELNRTAYWMPAMFDGTGNVVIPKSIVVYYKSNGTAAQAAATVALPEGLKIIGGSSKGNTTVTGYHNMVEFDCYDNSADWQYPLDAYGNVSGRTIPATCPSGHFLHAVVSFPQCYRGTGLELTDTAYQDEKENCPAGWVHMPQIQYIVDYPPSPTGSYANWYLSSDRMPGQPVYPNGSTLHGDWYGGWNKDVMNTWINSCIHPPRNCSLGQMGGTNLHLKRLPKDSTTLEDFAGPFFVKSPM